MTSGISKPLFALLMAVGVASMLSVLRPVAADPDSVDDLLPTRERRPSAPGPEAAFPRRLTRNLLRPPALRNQGYAPPPPPPPPVVAPVIAKPTAPSLPFVYLGRMVRDGEELVFLGQGENVEVAGTGDEVGQGWRLDTIGTASLQFRYLPLDETRQLVMSK